MIWKKIEGVIGPEREVSETGEVRQKTLYKKGLPLSNVFIRPYKNHLGQKYIRFVEGDSVQTRLLHRIVAEAHVSNREGMPHVLPVDGDSSFRDCSASNLYWGHAPRSAPEPYKLTNSAVDEIRASTLRNVDLAKQYGVSESMISRIRSGGRRCS